MSIRDILLFTVILGSIPFIIRRPYIGVLMYVWVSVMNPHRLTWGAAFDFEFAAVIAGVTLICALFSRDFKAPPVSGLIVVLGLFIAWTCVSAVFALYPEESYVRWKSLIKTQIFVFLILMLFHEKEQLRQLIWTIVLSVAYFGTKGGIWAIVTGGESKVWGPPGTYIEDNNALAVVIIMLVPMMRYLQVTTPYKYVRWGLTCMMLLCCVSALASHSRGALLAIGAMLAVLWWKTQRKLGLTLVAIVAIPLALTFLPENWYKRMDTIANYEEDASANMRLNAWETMFNLAVDRPLVGGGFEVASNEVYQKYSPSKIFHPQVAHSIYFEAMGEFGFVGFGLYLLLLFTFWRTAGTLDRLATGQPHLAWAGEFGRMMQVSLIGFATGGAFLSLVNFDVPYYLLAATATACAIVMRASADGATPVFAPGEKYPIRNSPSDQQTKARGF
jgi:probable O-glycosylation ligase (exosortase A-associated)